MKAEPVLVAAGVVALGVGFWRVLPSVIMLGAVLVLLGYGIAQFGGGFR